jgi:hypothetical protein
MSEYKYILNWPGRDWSGEIYRDGGDRYVQESSAYVLKADVERHGVVVSMVAWDGQGLPPVGTVCEVQTWVNREWKVTTVLAHHLGFGVHSSSTDGDDVEAEVAPCQDFRPLGSADREAAIAEMRELTRAPGVDYPVSYDQAARLYDAGYRKS